MEIKIIKNKDFIENENITPFQEVPNFYKKYSVNGQPYSNNLFLSQTNSGKSNFVINLILRSRLL